MSFRKFLRLLFGCHCRADRSFFYRGKQFPLCARCTGELIGIVLAVPTALFFGYPNTLYSLLMLLPLIIDGTTQRLTSYESTNIKRLITGIIFGFAIIFLMIHFHNFSLHLAKQLLTYIFKMPPPYI